MDNHTKFSELKEVFKTLHGPYGCSWDKQQTHTTLIPYLEEEVRELITALRNGNPGDIKEELGDVLLHVMFQSAIASRNDEFDIEAVITGLIQKLKRRHPHVFANTAVSATHEIMANWKKIKAQEKQSRQQIH